MNEVYFTNNEGFFMTLSKALADCAVKINKTMEDLLPGALGAEAILCDAMKYSSLGEGKKDTTIYGASVFQPVRCKRGSCVSGGLSRRIFTQLLINSR